MDDDFAKSAFEEAPIGLVLTEHRIIRACNQTFVRMLEYEKADLIDQSFRMLYASGEEFERVRDIGLEPLKRDEFYSDERLVQCRSGKSIWCRFRAHTLTPSDPLAKVVMSFARISETPPVSLSPRERQVLAQISQGFTSKEIARALSLSPRTIDDVRARLLKRFDVRNSAELLVRLTYLDH